MAGRRGGFDSSSTGGGPHGRRERSRGQGQATSSTRSARASPPPAAACPHADVDEATELLLETVPGLPATPTLPNRHAAEGMLGQAAWGMTGVVVDERGGLVVADPDAVGADDVGDGAGDLPAEPFGATLAFLDALAAAPLAGPGEAPVHRPGHARHRAGGRRRRPPPGVPGRRHGRPPPHPIAGGRHPHAGCRARPLVVVIDEPSLGAATLGDAPVGVEEAVDLVSGALAAVEADAVSGLHCCAVADWGAVLRAGPAAAVDPGRDRRLGAGRPTSGRSSSGAAGWRGGRCPPAGPSAR